MITMLSSLDGGFNVCSVHLFCHSLKSEDFYCVRNVYKRCWSTWSLFEYSYSRHDVATFLVAQSAPITMRMIGYLYDIYKWEVEVRNPRAMHSPFSVE